VFYSNLSLVSPKVFSPFCHLMEFWLPWLLACLVGNIEYSAILLIYVTANIIDLMDDDAIFFNILIFMLSL